MRSDIWPVEILDYLGQSLRRDLGDVGPALEVWLRERLS